MEAAEFFIQLAGILIAARVAGEIAFRFGAPSVIGELTAGIILGPSLLGWLEAEEVIRLLAGSVIVLLGAMIPIGAALESRGGSELLANALVDMTEGLPAVAVRVILMVITMTLSDVLNNVATALVAAPIVIAFPAACRSTPTPSSWRSLWPLSAHSSHRSATRTTTSSWDPAGIGLVITRAWACRSKRW